jgi:hypothetical protein
MANTTRFMIEIPDVGADADMWGTILNNYFNALEPKIFDRSAGDTVSGPLTVTGLTSVDALTATGVVTGNGSGLTNLNAANIATGIIGNARTTATFNATANTIVLRGAQGGFSANLVNVTGLTSTGTVNTPTVNGATTLALQTGGVDRVTLTQGGNLLVGGTGEDTPDTRLLLRSAVELGSAAPIFTTINANAGARQFSLFHNGANLGMYNARDGFLAFGTNNTERARITSGGFLKASNTGSYTSAGGGTDFSAAGFHNLQSNANSVTIYVTNTNSGSSVENFRSDLPSASTGIHFSATLNNGAAVYKVLANGNVQNTNNSYGAISDIKLKENITDATPKLDSLNKLRVVNYNLKADESKLKQIGLIAQEVEAIFPGLVESTPDTVEVTKTRTVEVPAVLDEEGNEVTPATKTEETYTEREPNGEVTKAVKYSVLVPMLLKAVQELSAQNSALTDRIAVLEAK